MSTSIIAKIICNQCKYESLLMFDVSFYSSVNLTAFIFGIVIGFTGPNLELFKSDDTPLASGKITTDEESWISSLAAFGAIGFTLAYGYISEKFGRKKAILLIGIPQTVSQCFEMSYHPENIPFKDTKRTKRIILILFLKIIT